MKTRARLTTEPVAAIAAIEAVLALAIGFGLDVSGEQVALIMAAVTSCLALFVRSQVTPVRTLGVRTVRVRRQLHADGD